MDRGWPFLEVCCLGRTSQIHRECLLEKSGRGSEQCFPFSLYLQLSTPGPWVISSHKNQSSFHSVHWRWTFIHQTFILWFFFWVLRRKAREMMHWKKRLFNYGKKSLKIKRQSWKWLILGKWACYLGNISQLNFILYQDMVKHGYNTSLQIIPWTAATAVTVSANTFWKGHWTLSLFVTIREQRLKHNRRLLPNPLAASCFYSFHRLLC